VPDFLSDEWFRRARELMEGGGPLPGVGYRIQFEADGERWHQAKVGLARLATETT
jgi:hypothetical protein